MTPTDREPVHVHRHGADPLRVEPVEYHEPLDRRPRVWLVVAVLIVIVAVLFVTQVAGGSDVYDRADADGGSRAPADAVPGERRAGTERAGYQRGEAAPAPTRPGRGLGVRPANERTSVRQHPRNRVGDAWTGLPATDTVGIAPAATGLRGWATYYDAGSGNAAAGPALRQALGGDPAFRGESVRVCAGGRCLVTRLTDWCACGPRHGQPTLIDLARVDFARLASPSRGVLLVTIEFDAPSSTLPPTSTVR